MKRYVFILISLLLCALIACGKDTPPETDTIAVTDTDAVTQDGVTTATETEPPEPEAVFSVYADGAAVLDLLTGVSVPFEADGEAAVTVINTADGRTARPVFVCDGKEVPVENGRITCTGTVTASAICSDGTVFAADPSLIQSVGADGVFVMTSDMSADGEVQVNVPFTWETRGHTFTADTLIFGGEGGVTVIKNGDGSISCRRVVCDTPGRRYEIEEEFSDFCERGFCFVRAESVNGRSVDESSLLLDSEEKVLYYTDGGALSIPDFVKTVTFSGVSLGDLTVRDPVGLIFSPGSTVSGALSLESDHGGVFSLTDENDPPVLAGSVSVFAPDAELIWHGGEPSADFADRYFTVGRYNGLELDAMTGGDPSLLPDGVRIGGNAIRPDGYYIDMTVTYDAGLPTVKSRISGLPDTVEGKLSESGGALYLTVTDGERSCGYRINSGYTRYYLPRICIDTQDGAAVESHDEYINCTVTVDYNGAGGFAAVSGAPCRIRGRGSSSWKLDKKPYRLKFDGKTSLFGLTPAKNWVLQANHADKSLMRNTVAMAIGAKLTNMPFVPHSYLCDVFLNGKYVGTYSLTEHVEVQDGRIEGERDGGDIDTDYLLELGEEGKQTSFGKSMFGCELTRYAEIKNPGADKLTYEQYIYIREYVYDADNAVKTLDGYEDYIDVDSLIDWFILHELSFNADNSFRRSVFLLKKKGGKLYLACPWDFDYAFGNYFRDLDDPVGWICLGNENTHDENFEIKRNWMTYLLQDESFKKKLKARWEQVKDDLISTANDTVDRLYGECAPSAEANFAVWGILGKTVQYEKHGAPKTDTFKGNVDYLRDYLNRRYEWMDSEISSY
ncbi:MAG: CotH kinase family protein [Clostridia bacterium]|nr:CotH kinase family protein [Clostridia bacterium]